MKTFKCSFPIDFAFNMSIRCSKCTPQPEIIFYSVDFLVAIIYRYFLFSYMQKNIQYSFYLCYSPSVFTPFHYFYCFTPLQHKCLILKCNTISLFQLICKISFGFLPIKEKSLRPLRIGL